MAIIRLKQLTRLIGISKSGIYNKMRINPKRPQDYDPSFPQPIPLGGRAVGWVDSEVNAWIAGQKKKRSSEKAEG